MPTPHRTKVINPVITALKKDQRPIKVKKQYSPSDTEILNKIDAALGQLELVANVVRVFRDEAVNMKQADAAIMIENMEKLISMHVLPSDSASAFALTAGCVTTMLQVSVREALSKLGPKHDKPGGIMMLRGISHTGVFFFPSVLSSPLSPPPLFLRFSSASAPLPFTILSVSADLSPLMIPDVFKRGCL